jgi:hypothetical protein
MHRDEGDPVNDVHKALVGECVARLQKLRSSAIATRGAHLLSALLAEVEQMPRSAPRVNVGNLQVRRLQQTD